MSDHLFLVVIFLYSFLFSPLILYVILKTTRFVVILIFNYHDLKQIQYQSSIQRIEN